MNEKIKKLAKSLIESSLILIPALIIAGRIANIRNERYDNKMEARTL